MNKILKIVITVSVILSCGCSITSHLERRQYRADALHVSRERREQERQQTFPSQVFKIERDSNRFNLVPIEVLDDGERIMSVPIEQVTIRAMSRTLPERLGKVLIDFVIDMPRQLLGTCQSIVIIPYLHKPRELKPLQEITIRGGLFSRVQERDYWQYERYVRLFSPNTTAMNRAFSRFVKYPYPEYGRLDSVVQHPGHISYYYSEEVPTNEISKSMFITLQGWVTALDDSYYSLPPSDTLTYNISSMLSFVDTATKFKIKVIDKYAVVQDRNYIQFQKNDTHVIDTLGDNGIQLTKISSLLTELLEQEEFYVDSIVLTASASPEGNYAHNNDLARGRARALRRYLARKHGWSIDTLVAVRWVAEDWTELSARIIRDDNVTHREQILKLIDVEPNPDRREDLIRKLFPKDYRYLREIIYPSLRAVSFRYDLRRRGMIKDTIHTREIDTLYSRGVKLLQERKYAKALYILNEYNDRNTIVAHLSMGHDRQALELLEKLPPTAIVEYLKAIACSRLERKTEGRKHFLAACNMDEQMQYRGNLDPEITELLKD